MIEEKCKICFHRSFWIQLLGTGLVTALKLVFGVLGNSQALLADALHCSSNVLTSFGIAISRLFGNRPVDHSYPYGYGKIEYVISAIVSGLIIALTLSLVFVAFRYVLHPEVAEPPKGYVFLVAIMSILVNELLFRYLHCVGERFNSSVLRANSWGIRADSLTSLAVIISVAASKLGFRNLDGLVALIVAVTIIWTCGKCLADSIHHLLDGSISHERLFEIKSSVEQFVDVRVKDIHARFVGSKIWTDIEIEIDEDNTVEAFHAIASKVKRAVFNANPAVENVLVNYSLCRGAPQNV